MFNVATNTNASNVRICDKLINFRYAWTQGIPETKSGATPGVGRDCFIFDWSQDWTADVKDSDFAPPPGMKCSGLAGGRAFV